MRQIALALLIPATLALAACCNIPCDPCCHPCPELTAKPSLFQSPPPRGGALPGELPAGPAPVPGPAPAAEPPPPALPAGPLDQPEVLESR
jgi:hypothetical protein